MLSIFFGLMLAVNMGPVGTDPAREPQLAARGSFVAMTFGAGDAIYFSASHDAGRTFAPPVKVSEAAIVPLTRHRGPRIAFANSTLVISAVTGSTPSQEKHAHGLPSDGDLVVWRSVDNGKTWSKGAVINDVPGAPTEGLHTLAADAKGNLFAAWLDKRTGNGTTLYGARSSDAGATWSKNFLLYQSPDGTICECCHPSAAFTPEGELFVMWRNWLDGSRDMYLTRSLNGAPFAKPEKLGQGTWKLNACPMDGGGLAISQGHVFTAWRRDHTIYMAEPGGRETELGQGKDVAIAVGPSGVYAVWDSSAGIELHAPFAAPMQLSSAGGFPAIAALSDGSAVVAWEETGRITAKRIN